MATEFIEALMVEDYEAAMERMMFGKDGTFVDADGVAWYLPRTDLRDIVGMDGKVIDIVEGEGTSSKKIEVTVATDDGAEQTVELLCSLNDNNDYKINVLEMYIEDWKVRVPGNSVLYIDGKEVSKDYFDKKDNLYDVYNIPALIKKDTEIKIVLDGFGEYTETVMVADNAEVENVKFWIDGEEAQDILNGFKDVFNKLVASYGEGKSVSDVLHFFSDSMDTATIDKIYNDNIGNGLYQGGKNSNIVMTAIKPNPDENLGIFPRSDKVVVINFGYILNWKGKY